MTPAQQWWYRDQLERKQSRLEDDHKRVTYWLGRAPDDFTRRRLTRELEEIDMRLAKVKRGVLHG